MNAETFNLIIEEQIKRSTDVLLKKAVEYATDEDRLHNFKVAGALKSETMKKALAGMMSKHTVSVYDMCTSKNDFPIEVWNEKITDHINYLLLLRATIEDKECINKHDRFKHEFLGRPDESTVKSSVLTISERWD